MGSNGMTENNTGGPGQEGIVASGKGSFKVG